MSNLEFITNCVVNGDRDQIKDATMKALDNGLAPMAIINEGLINGMEKVGELYEAQEYFLPELLLAADAMESSLSILKPMLNDEDRSGLGTVLIGTVQGDVHDIGKNIVKWMLEGSGFQVEDLGVDVPLERFIEAVTQRQPNIIALSALLTTSAHQMKKVIDALKDKGLKQDIKVMVGGAAINQDFAERIGADGYALDAVLAVAKAKELIGVQ